VYKRIINSLSPRDQEELVKAAQVFVNSNPSTLARHVAFHLQVMPREETEGCGGMAFLNWHHSYLTAFENYLERTGRGRRLTPVPEWKPGHRRPGGEDLHHAPPVHEPALWTHALG
jgi:hypothetical protein